MSNHLEAIDLAELAHVKGGDGSVYLGTRKIGVGGSWSTPWSQRCLDNNQRIARDKYPDNRWFWQRWAGQEDPNAGPRAEYEQQHAQSCGPQS